MPASGRGRVLSVYGVRKMFKFAMHQRVLVCFHNESSNPEFGTVISRNNDLWFEYPYAVQLDRSWNGSEPALYMESELQQLRDEDQSWVR